MGKGLRVVVACCLVSAAHAQSATTDETSRPQPVVGARPAGDAPDEHDDVVALCGFQPGTLPRQEMEAKSGKLDHFWSKVQADPAAFGPALRRELARDDAPLIFLYDGSILLLKFHEKEAGFDTAPVDKDDARLVNASMARCTLKGVDHAEYLFKVRWLASEGNDTTAAAFHVLAEPDFQAFVPRTR